MELIPIGSSSSGNCYILRSGDSAIMIEAGLPWKRVQKALDFKTRDIAFCLVSHSHADHAGYVGNVMLAGIDVYGLQDVKEKFSIEHYRFCVIEQPMPFKLYEWTVRPFQCVHDVPCLGFLIASGGEKALYLSDSMYSPYRFGSGLTHIFVEINYSMETLAPNLDPVVKKRLIRNHMSLDTAKKLLAANDLSKVQEIHLLHLSRDNSNAEYFKSEIQKLTGKSVHIAAA